MNKVANAELRSKKVQFKYFCPHIAKPLLSAALSTKLNFKHLK